MNNSSRGVRLSYDVEYRVWLKKNGRFLIGEGRAKLLRLIKEYNSISKAAEKMGMSYRHAWGTIKKIESALGEKILVSERGGQEGGTSKLTPAGELLLRKFENQCRMIDDQIRGLYERPTVACDGILIMDGRLLLVKRGREPFKEMYALPGGILEYGERAENCVKRELLEETGLKTKIIDLIGVYSDPERDPRGHFISIVYHLKPCGGELNSGDDAAAVGLFPLDDLPELAFDHAKIISDFLERYHLE